MARLNYFCFLTLRRGKRGVNRGEQDLIGGRGVGWGSVNRGEQGLISEEGVGGDQLIEESGAYKGKGGGLNKAFTVNSI